MNKKLFSYFLYNNFKKKTSSLFFSEKGGVAILFIAIAPIFVIFMGLYFDSVQLNAKRARLSDAVDEGTLAISSYNLGDDPRNRIIVQRYLDVYFPEAVSYDYVNIDITSETDDCLTRYNVSARAEVDMYFHFSNLPGFNSTERVEANSRGCRIKGGLTGDYAFVVDISSSMGEEIKDKLGNVVYDAQGEPLRGMTMLKTSLKSFIKYGLEHSNESMFAFIPFDVGVTVRLPGKNERGGPIFGCSVVFTPKDEYDIDYAYWSNKFVAKNYADKDNIDAVVRTIEAYRYEYYRDYVGKYGGGDVANYCVRNGNYDANVEGSIQWSCVNDLNDINSPYPGTDAYKKTSLLYDSYRSYFSAPSASNSDPLGPTEEALRYRKLPDKFYQQWKKAAYAQDLAINTYRNLANIETMDIAKTLENMFSDDGVVTIPYVWSLSARRFRAFYPMCKAIPSSNYNNYEVPMAEAYAMTQLVELDRLQESDVDRYLPDISSKVRNPLHEAKTDTMAGLLRAVPVVAKGNNGFKAIIIVSDGADNQNQDLTQALIYDWDACEKIRQGLLARNATKVGIYFILTATDDEVSANANLQTHVNRWKHCVKEEGNFVMANDLDSLKEAFFNIMAQNREMAVFY